MFVSFTVYYYYYYYYYYYVLPIHLSYHANIIACAHSVTVRRKQ